jgi:uncharacterized protein (TIGR02265 family)
MASTTNHSMFEALFDRRLKPTGPFAQALEAAGYDRAHASAKYPTEVWVACLEIARAHAYATLELSEAYRHLGREFCRGFLETLPGRLIGAAIPFMTPPSFLRKLATYIRMGRNDDRLTVELHTLSDRSAQLVVHNPAAVPGGFVGGMIDVAMEKLKAQHTLAIEQKTPFDYVLRVTW